MELISIGFFIAYLHSLQEMREIQGDSGGLVIAWELGRVGRAVGQDGGTYDTNSTQPKSTTSSHPVD